MKLTIRTLAVALTLAPAAAFAQGSNAPMTHGRAMNQLTQLRQNGYVPSNIHYPADIQAAEARVAIQNDTNMTANSGYGGTAATTEQSGHRDYRSLTGNGFRSMYEHH